MFDFLNELIEYDAKRSENTSTAKSQFMEAPSKKAQPCKCRGWAMSKRFEMALRLSRTVP
ncbi:MAG: hypothetical protein OHK0037_21840 [Elainellaceae cyanobacterium]